MTRKELKRNIKMSMRAFSQEKRLPRKLKKEIKKGLAKAEKRYYTIYTTAQQVDMLMNLKITPLSEIIKDLPTKVDPEEFIWDLQCQPRDPKTDRYF